MGARRDREQLDLTGICACEGPQMKWFKRGGVLNIVSSLATVALCLYLGMHWLDAQPVESPWRGVGQSLLAASAVAFVALLGALLQYIFVTRPFEALVGLGIRRFRKRGSPGSNWPKQLRAVKRNLVFFGKDHNKLMKHDHILKSLLLDQQVSIAFYLLDADDSYYEHRPEEQLERLEAARALYSLKDEVATSKPIAGSRLLLHQYKNTPTFTCTLLDETIVFGPYVAGLDNTETPEFEIEPGEDTWLYDACHKALNAATATSCVSTLIRPPPDANATVKGA
jgi:hypothetical protein